MDEYSTRTTFDVDCDSVLCENKEMEADEDLSEEAIKYFQSNKSLPLHKNCVIYRKYPDMLEGVNFESQNLDNGTHACHNNCKLFHQSNSTKLVSSMQLARQWLLLLIQ